MEPHDEPFTHTILYHLPSELMTIILAKLKLQDLLNVACTCKKLRSLVVDNNALWRMKCSQMLTVNHANSHNGSSNNYSLSPYHHCRISCNWHRGYFREMIIAKSTIKYIPWLSLQPDCLILSTGSTLSSFGRDHRKLPSCKQTMWKVNVPKVIRRDIRTNDISRFVVKDNVIVCGNRDGCIAVYDRKNESQTAHTDLSHEPVLKSHIRDCHENGAAEISAVDCFGRCEDICIVSASSDSRVIKFWKQSSRDDIDDLNRLSDVYINASGPGLYIHSRGSFTCVRSTETIGGEGGKCLLMDPTESRLAVGLKGSRLPLLCDVEMGRVLNNPTVMQSRREWVKDITWLNERTVAYVTHAGYLHCLDARTGQIVYLNFDPLASSLYCLKSDGRHAIVTGSSQFSRCTLYDARNSKGFVQLLFTQRCSSPVYSVDFDAATLTAAAERGVAVLSFNVNPTTTRRRDYAAIVSSFSNSITVEPS